MGPTNIPMQDPGLFGLQERLTVAHTITLGSMFQHPPGYFYQGPNGTH